MLPFSTLLLRSYYEAIGWNEDNLYSNITRSSSALIDFAVPNSLILQLANAPTPIFFTSYALDALPQLNGSLSYITTSEPLTIGPSRTMPFRDVVERFRHYPPPTKPVGKPELWLGGRRIEGRDFLFYSRMHLPTMHLSGLAVTRLAPTLQAHIAFVHQPQRVRFTPPTKTAASVAPTSPPQPPPNLLVALQHDTGMYSGEYTYSAADGMCGVSPHVSMATRFGVNVYSYESDFAIGGEWWVGRRGRQRQVELSPEARLQIAKHAAIGGRLRDEPGEPGPEAVSTAAVVVNGDEAQLEAQARRDARVLDDPDERDGVLKARLSGNWSLALLYEARIRKSLVSVGLVSDVFGGTGRAIRGVGLEVQYCS
ncbi:hypothetical protein CspHIS471_0501510 [Cutaneotrichosporon sp. HIS471]|nr:hypothetical protein CspHIS471_0501510 [Cutaneotrichosporon sp. HIS471]